MVDRHVELGIKWLKERQIYKEGIGSAEEFAADLSAMLERGDFSSLNKHSFYVSTKASGDPNERAKFHVHIDAQQLLSGRTTLALLGAGLTYDVFDPNAHIYGVDGDETKPFGCHNPAQHMTLATQSFEEFIDRMALAINIITASGEQAYIEGEYITYDEKIAPKPFDMAAYNALVPLATLEDKHSFLSAITGERRVLPALAIQRRLQPGVVDPLRKKPDPAARTGEVHLTLRNDTHPLLLELFGNMGFACPAISKFLEGDNELLALKDNGSLREVVDFPLTVQTLDMKTVQTMANVAVYLCEEIGGVKTGSWKLEIAPQFWVARNIDYNTQVPPVIKQLHIDQRFHGLPKNRIGTIPINMGNAVRMITDIAKAGKVVKDGGLRIKRHDLLFGNTVRNTTLPYAELIAKTSFGRRQMPTGTWQDRSKREDIPLS